MNYNHRVTFFDQDQLELMKKRVFELLDQVFLIAALVRLEHDLSRCHRAIVGDVEEIADLVEQGELAALDGEVFAQGNDTVGPFAPARAMFELDQLL